MKPLVAFVAIAHLAACVGAPVRATESEERANLASAPLPKAEACIEAAPCVQSTGVWLPPALAAETAGWGEGLVACKARLEKCDSTGLDTVGAWLLVAAGVVAGGLTAVGAYELRDWLKR